MRTKTVTRRTPNNETIASAIYLLLVQKTFPTAVGYLVFALGLPPSSPNTLPYANAAANPSLQSGHPQLGINSAVVF